MIGVNEYLPGAAVCLFGFGLLAWLNRRPQSWWEGRPRPEQPTLLPVKATIVRQGPGRELVRRDDGGGP
jgi:hypothetical protein